MKHNTTRLLVTLLAVVCLTLLIAPTALAQSKSLDWHRWDAEIEINADGTFDVREVYEIEFIGGPYTFGYRNILKDQFEGLENVSVSEDGATYAQAYGEQPHTFYVQENPDEYLVQWFFPPTENATRTFVVEYTVRGGLIINEEVGDRFFWKAVGADHAFPIESSTVTVRMPPGATVDTSIEPATFGVANARYEVSDDGRVVTFFATDIPANQEFEVGVRFPHGFVPAEKPSWQAEYEQEQTWNDRYRPVLNLAFGGVAVLLLVGGLLGVYLLWTSRGRDPDVGAVPEYLSEPPSELRPGVVGTLLDEQADLQDIIATLVDLARRGAIDMQEIERSTFLGLSTTKEFVFRRRDDFDGALRPYERTLIKKMFGNRDEVKLEDLQNKFYTAIPTLQDQLYEEAVEQGLFAKNPKSVRNRWMALGIGGLVVAVGAAFCAGAALGNVTIDALLCPFASLGIVSIAMLILSRAMPVKTRLGAEEAAKWRAFETYLKNAEAYADLEQVTEQFDRYLPYAIALGLERTWVNKFSRIEGTPIPRWYYPVGIPYGTGRYSTSTVGGRPGAPLPTSAGGAGPRDLRGDAVRPAPSLDRMSEGMFGSLSSMSAGLFSMLNSTANTFRSTPSSSSGGGFRGGGGGFSGGGFSGGGGGGGGGAGFG